MKHHVCAHGSQCIVPITTLPYSSSIAVRLSPTTTFNVSPDALVNISHFYRPPAPYVFMLFWIFRFIFSLLFFSQTFFFMDWIYKFLTVIPGIEKRVILFFFFYWLCSFTLIISSYVFLHFCNLLVVAFVYSFSYYFSFFFVILLVIRDFIFMFWSSAVAGFRIKLSEQRKERSWWKKRIFIRRQGIAVFIG